MESFEASPVLAPFNDIPTHNGGARFEADIFVALFARADVIRALEFATVDGVLDCTIDPISQARSFADRFWELRGRVSDDPRLDSRILVPFDIKSRASRLAEDQIYITSINQRRNVAFFVGICAANPDFVEVIPNVFGGHQTSNDDATRNVAVNLARKSLLRPSAYGFLSPCNSAYRMPLDLLPAALDCLRACALRDIDYVNPWTQACWHGWRPLTFRSDELLFPDETTQGQHLTAYEGTSRIRWAVRHANLVDGIPIDFDFMYLQPLLADFKLIINDVSSPVCGQWFVQYKIDGRERSRETALTEVAIGRSKGRSKGRKTSYYFTDFERFDYLFYEFQFPIRESGMPVRWEKWFFFLPERILPNRYYTSLALNDKFTDPEFKEYWVYMDLERKWVETVYSIIKSNPNPRRPGYRPRRELSQDKEADDEEELARKFQLPTPSRPLDWFDEKFFKTVMDQCARRLSGLLIVLARGHLAGDFAYCRYQWTEQERYAYFEHFRPPCTISTLPSCTPTVPISVFARQRVGTARGPSLTAAEVRDLNSCASPRILCFDSFGLMGRESCCPLLVVPSDDISHTKGQRDVYEAVLKTNKRDEFSPRVPLLAEQLHTKCAIADYAIGASGPMIFENNSEQWDQVWTLFNSFSGLDHFSFPEAHTRQPYRYQVTVQELHQQLVDEHMRTDSKLLILP